jgi:glycine/D-amino acid oxidase-like deaminating enzyme
MQKFDNLIVGAGLAGVWTAYRFMQEKKTFVLLDLKEKNTSSRVAAGIYNPLLAKRQKVSYNAKNLYPNLYSNYHELEVFLQEKFCHKHHVSYIIENLRELNDWASLSDSDWFSDFVRVKNERISDLVVSDFGYIDILDSGWVDIPLFLDAFLSKIHAPNMFLNQAFDDNYLVVNQDNFQYEDFLFDHVVFCQGTAIDQNKYTLNIRLKPAKGEILTIESQEHLSQMIPQNGVFLLPVSEKKYKVGSNFTWDNLDNIPSESAKLEIIQKLCKWYKAPFEITNHVAGVRPSSLDRRPILGRLDFHPKAFILNGFGSKGVSHAPYYSKMLSRLIYGNVNVDKDVDVSRFK